MLDRIPLWVLLVILLGLAVFSIDGFVRWVLGIVVIGGVLALFYFHKKRKLKQSKDDTT